MSSYSTGDGSMSLTITFKLGTEPRPGAGAGPEPRRLGDAAPAGRGAPARRDHAQELARPDDGRSHAVAGRQLRPALHLELRLDPHPRPVAAPRRRRRHPALRRPRILDPRLARSEPARRLSAHRSRYRSCPAGAEHPGLGRCARPAAGADGCRLPAHRADAGAFRGCAPVPAGDRQVLRRRAPRARRRRGACRARRPRLRHELVPERQACRGARHLPAPGHQCARRRGGHHQEDERAQARFPLRASTTRSSTTRPSSSPSRCARSTRRCSRRWSSSSSSSSCSCSRGARRSSRSSRSRCRSSALSR